MSELIIKAILDQLNKHTATISEEITIGEDIIQRTEVIKLQTSAGKQPSIYAT